MVDLRKVDFSNYTFEDLEKTTPLQATLKAKIGAGRLAFVMPPKGAYKPEMYKFNTDHKVDVTIKNFTFDEYDKALK